MKAMETLQDLIEEAKVRTLWWAICIFGIAYFLSHTSKSMWTNILIAFVMLSALRLLLMKWNSAGRFGQFVNQHLFQLQKKQLSLDDPRISPLPTAPRWSRKIDSPLVEAAVGDFINKILEDFMVDLWYSAITPDKEAPDQSKSNYFVRFGDMVDLIGDH